MDKDFKAASMEGSCDIFSSPSQGQINIQTKFDKEKYAEGQLPEPNQNRLEVLRKSNQCTLHQERLMISVPKLLNLSASKP